MRIRALVSVTLPMTGPVKISTDQFLSLRLEPFELLLVITNTAVESKEKVHGQ